MGLHRNRIYASVVSDVRRDVSSKMILSLSVGYYSYWLVLREELINYNFNGASYRSPKTFFNPLTFQNENML